MVIITIDGPAGSGKSTIAKLLAKHLNLLYINTGATYRAITLKLLRLKINLEDEERLREVLENTEIDLEGDRTILDGVDVSEEIHRMEVEEMVSKVSAISLVRKKMVEIQRKIAERGRKKGVRGVIAEGRDTGTVVFPNADVKIFLTATPEERAKRRMKDQKYKDTLSYQNALKNILERDKIDSTRQDSPLQIPQGAIIIDTTDLSIEQVLEKILSYLKNYV